VFLGGFGRHVFAHRTVGEGIVGRSWGTDHGEVGVRFEPTRDLRIACDFLPEGWLSLHPFNVVAPEFSKVGPHRRVQIVGKILSGEPAARTVQRRVAVDRMMCNLGSIVFKIFFHESGEISLKRGVKEWSLLGRRMVQMVILDRQIILKGGDGRSDCDWD